MIERELILWQLMSSPELKRMIKNATATRVAMAEEVFKRAMAEAGTKTGKDEKP